MLPVLQIEKAENCGLEKLGRMFKTAQDNTFSLVADLLAINPMLFKTSYLWIKEEKHTPQCVINHFRFHFLLSEFLGRNFNAEYIMIFTIDPRHS